MRILLVNWLDLMNPQAGGAEVHLHEIFGRLAQQGHSVHLLCSGWKGAKESELVTGIKVHRVSTRYGFTLQGRGAFKELAARLKPDVVVEDVNKVPLYLPQLWRGPFALLVPHLFGDTVFREMPLPLASLVWASERPMPRVYANAGVHAISQATKADLVERGFSSERIEVILPGVDTARYTPSDPRSPTPDSPVFLYIGRLKRYKQVSTALSAFARLHQWAPDARLLIAGTGDDQDRLVAEARSLGIQDVVQFLGFVAEERKIELYRSATAVLMPSLKEGWGITNLEAAACGTPAIAADNSALRESVRDGETGFLVATHDIPAWAEAMGRATDRSVRERLSRGARAFAETFSWERTAQQTIAHLEAVVARGPRGQEP